MAKNANRDFSAISLLQNRKFAIVGQVLNSAKLRSPTHMDLFGDNFSVITFIFFGFTKGGGRIDHSYLNLRLQLPQVENIWWPRDRSKVVTHKAWKLQKQLILYIR